MNEYLHRLTRAARTHGGGITGSPAGPQRPAIIRAYGVAAQVVDPELRVVTIAELGILRQVATDGDRAVVTITPTYSGCPAMDVIRAEVTAALRDAGWSRVELVTQLHPPWTTDWISEAGRSKLAAAGIAPPGRAGAPVSLGYPAVRAEPACPRCGGTGTEELSRFGTTACQALWRCHHCREPFAHVKPF